MEHFIKCITVSIIAMLLSCLIFGCEIGEKDGVAYFQWGFYHYKKKRDNRL